MFKEYIIDLCRRHHDIHHRDDEIHFIDLSTDRRNTALAHQMRYPGVFLDRVGYTYRTTGNGLRRYANMTLDIWQHVTDTADYDQIERVIEKCDSILNDFVMMMMTDRRSRKHKFLLGISFNGMQVQEIMNEQNALYGVRASFLLPENQCITDIEERFRIEGTFDPTFTKPFD